MKVHLVWLATLCLIVAFVQEAESISCPNGVVWEGGCNHCSCGPNGVRACTIMACGYTNLPYPCKNGEVIQLGKNSCECENSWYCQERIPFA